MQTSFKRAFVGLQTTRLETPSFDLFCLVEKTRSPLKRLSLHKTNLSKMFHGKLWPKPRIKHLSGRRRNRAKNKGIVFTGFNLKIASECSKYMKISRRAIMARSLNMPKRFTDRIVRLHTLLHLQYSFHLIPTH